MAKDIFENLKRISIIRGITFVVLLCATGALATASWRLPLDISDSYFAELTKVTLPGTEQLLGLALPITKSELLLAALLSLMAGYICWIVARGYLACVLLTGLAAMTTFTALAHRYIPGSPNSILDVPSGLFAPVIAFTRNTEAKALSAPTETSQSVEILPPNTSVMLSARENGWYKVTVSGGRVGWIAADKIIVP